MADAPFWRRNLPAIVIGLIDVFAIGFGMGVPVFAILLGLPAGWWLARRDVAAGAAPDRDSFRRALVWSGALAGVSLILLLVIWGPQLPIVFDRTVSASEWGIPPVLYASQASKIGWMVLMLFISPALQFMAVVTGAVIGFAAKEPVPHE